MNILFSPWMWGTPIGLGVFFAGLGVLLWGVSRIQKANE